MTWNRKAAASFTFRHQQHAGNVTIVSRASALGPTAPAFLSKGKRGTTFVMTTSVFMTSNVFEQWLHHFAKYKIAGNLLTFGGASSHLGASIVTAAESRIIITFYCLPIDTIQGHQPSDKLVFKAFGSHYGDELSFL
jgi:hypothetical protein